MPKIKQITQQETLINNAWLNLDEKTLIDDKLTNPFQMERVDKSNPYHHLLKIMMNPNYFGFTCKYILNKQLHPFQLAILKELWTRPFPMLIATRGGGKSFLLAVYAILRAMINQGCKVAIVGAAFRQAKVVFDYCEEIWRNAPILRDMCGKDKRQGPRRDVDRCTLRIGDSLIFALPLGDGTKIRGQRANYIICDEFASVPVDIYENVVAGFAVVSSDPIEKIQNIARTKEMKRLGLINEEDEKRAVSKLNFNQAIISGTAYYGFNHFCEYWKRWKKIIESKGDKKKLDEIFEGKSEENFNWQDYCVIRIPHELLPDGFMDSKHIAKSRATVHKSNFLMEFAATFPIDSDGFYRRSLVESCVVGKPTNPIVRDGIEVEFYAILRGNRHRRYIMAIDPASERDNFSIVILECYDDHRRIVYCWTTTRAKYNLKLKTGKIKEQDFYGYCARKVRDLLALFHPCERIVCDSQGGGVAIMEALHDPDKMKEYEIPIWEIVDPEKPKDTDNKVGQHILEMINFADSKWVSEANHGLRKDFEDKALLFPMFDSISIGEAIQDDTLMSRDGMEIDKLEDCIFEIEELKDELASIVHTQTGGTLRDHWSTPEIKMPGGKKGRLRKDRYSALLMANMVARTLQRAYVPEYHHFMGGFVKDIAKQKEVQNQPVKHQNPSWYQQLVEGNLAFGEIVKRKV